MPTPKIKILHVVTGGFSGATAVAKSLVKHATNSSEFETLLVLRRKRQTRASQLQALADEGVPFVVVPGWSHLATIYALVKIFRQYKPQLLVAHGFSDHIWARVAGKIAGVPVMIHVEHNSRERYTAWRLALSRWLNRYTAWNVGVSAGVRASLVELGFPVEKCIYINNGIDLSPFRDAATTPYLSRESVAVMSARFARQKDHATLIHAIALLKQQGIVLKVILIGGGSRRHRQRMEQLTRKLELTDRIEFRGRVDHVPALLAQCQIHILSTHYEGMPLALVEAMAAGCVVVASDVVGVREMLQHQVTGYIVAHRNAQALADRLQYIMENPQAAAAIAKAGQQQAEADFSLELMLENYESLFRKSVF